MHPVMGAAEAERLQFMVGVADKIPVGEEQQLDQVPAQVAGSRAGPLRTLHIGVRSGLRNLCQSC